jgi:hypothetical protein
MKAPGNNSNSIYTKTNLVKQSIAETLPSYPRSHRIFSILEKFPICKFHVLLNFQLHPEGLSISLSQCRSSLHPSSPNPLLSALSKSHTISRNTEKHTRSSHLLGSISPIAIETVLGLDAVKKPMSAPSPNRPCIWAVLN